MIEALSSLRVETATSAKVAVTSSSSAFAACGDVPTRVVRLCTLFVAGPTSISVSRWLEAAVWARIAEGAGRHS